MVTTVVATMAVGSSMAAPALVLADQVLDPADGEWLPALSDLRHPVAAYLFGLAASSRRPQLAALEAIARRATAVYTVETMPWHRLRRPHVLRIRQLLEDHYQPAAANRMLAALLDAGVDLVTVQKMAGHASVSTTGRYDRRDHATQRRAAAQLHVPYVPPED